MNNLYTYSTCTISPYRHICINCTVRFSSCAFFPSCTELLTHYLENPKSYIFTVQRCTSVYCFNVLALRCTLFTHRNQNALHKNKTQRNQINFAKEPNLVPEPQVWTTLLYTVYCTVYSVLCTRALLSIHDVYHVSCIV